MLFTINAINTLLKDDKRVFFMSVHESEINEIKARLEKLIKEKKK